MIHRQFLLPALALIAASISAPVAAHVTIEPREAPANSYYKGQFRISHGCNGAPTVKVRVRMPAGVLSVKPQPKAGWQVEAVRVKLAQPVDSGHGQQVTESISEVVWSGGTLPDAHFDEFAVMMKLPDRPGATLYFPVVQECEQGANRWIEVPEAGKPSRDLREPAPALRLTPRQ